MKLLLYIAPLFILLSCSGKWEPTTIQAKQHQLFDLYHSDGVEFIISGKHKLFALTKEKGLFESGDDGTNWTKANTQGMPDSIPIINMIVKGEQLIAATSGYGVFISEDEGRTWKQANTGLYDTVQFKLDCDKELELERTEGKWKKFTRGSSDSDVWYDKIMNEFKAKDVKRYLRERLVIQSIAANGNNLVIYMAGNGIYTSSNNGKSWDKKELKDNTLLLNNSIGLAANEKNIFVYAYETFYRSSNLGNTWKKLHIDIPPDTAYIGEGGVVAYERTDIRTLYLNGKYIYAGTNNGLFVSADEGEHWKVINNGLPEKKPISAIIAVNNTLFVCPGDYQGIFISHNNGENWKPFNEGLRKNTGTQYHCGYITYFAASEKKIFAGVWTNGDCPDALWMRNLSDAE